jgi:hypothetical protein
LLAWLFLYGETSNKNAQNLLFVQLLRSQYRETPKNEQNNHGKEC